MVENTISFKNAKNQMRVIGEKIKSIPKTFKEEIENTKRENRRMIEELEKLYK
jgi:uncharacterized protein with HEPN domain